MKAILYLQSSYSMLNSLVSISELIFACKENKYEYIALSDEQLHGTYELFDLAKKNNIKPILGLKIKVYEPNETSFLVYVKNDVGYLNLLKISYLKANNHKFHINDLVKYQNGLIYVSTGYESIIDQTMLYGNEEVVLEYLDKYNTIFTDFYVGLSFNNEIQKKGSTKKIYEISRKNKYKCLPVHKTNYLNEEDLEIYKSLIKIENDKNEVELDANYQFLKVNESKELFSDFTEVKSGLEDFLKKINFDFNYPKFNMPNYQTKNNISSKEFLVSLARIGLKKRLKQNNISENSIYIKRLDHELDVICRMNFDNYFLIVYDFIKYAKENNVLVGPGRGSAAGSLVSYCLGITNVDPIKYNLIFERFLNPARMNMPDIDLDFPDNKRDFVIDYVKEKYGINHITSITTFGTFALRSSIRDIARTLKIQQSRVSGIIESVLNNKIDKTDEEVLRVLKIASKIEGLPRHTGTHAAGIILSNQDLTKTIPMQNGAFSFMQSQFDAKTLEQMGLHKIDFLGIKNLTIINEVLENLKSKNINIDINKIDFADQKTYNLLSSGDTTGIFQLESAGMRKVLEKLKPKSFEDIVATLALYRPGPMANIDVYIERRNGKKFEYFDPILKDILESTYGIIIYQEQIMQIAQVFAGYDLFEADMLRVGVSKKNHDILENERIKFIKGALKKGFDEILAKRIYDYIVKFGDYGFNRSHSVSYAIVAYQMAYLKANYYLDFMQVLLSSVIGNETQTSAFISEVINNGYKVKEPNLNQSSDTYMNLNNTLIMPLTVIRGFGKKTVSEILNERKKGLFNDLFDIKQRLANHINEKQFDSLVFSGALDYLALNRRTLIDNNNLSSASYDKFIKDHKITINEDYSFFENAKYEKEVIGINLKYDLSKIKLKDTYVLSKIPEKTNIFDTLAIITDKKEFLDKNNNKMFFVTISDGLNKLDAVLFDESVFRMIERYQGAILVINITRSKYKNKDSYRINSVKEYEKNKL